MPASGHMDRTAALATLIDWLLAPAELRLRCTTQMPVFANGSSAGDWSVCCAFRAASHDPCVVASIGIGKIWHFEDALAYAGCAVHAFDPTINLRKTHEAHALAMRNAGYSA